MSDFFQKHKKMLLRPIEDSIDMGVYSSSRNFCLPECTKNGQQRYLHIVSNQNF